MRESENPPPHPFAGEAAKSGLPAMSPDEVEQEHGLEFDDIVPTQGYQMLPLVGLGGSAGSIAALRKFFSAMPAQSGLAFVVVIHLSAEHQSTLAELLGYTTAMSVVQAVDGQEVEANHVYVIPPGKHLAAANGRLRLIEIERSEGSRTAVDLFFRTLADTHGPHAAAVVLSGADSDGAIGIKRIKERGGLTIAQDPDEAEHSSMPQAAINTGMVDWVLEVASIPPRLIDYVAREGRLKLPPEDGPQPDAPRPADSQSDEKALRDVLAYLRSRTGHDFSYYKRATIIRRISRRMQVNGVSTLPEYLDFLRTHPGEAGALLQDLLISVTNFFRDRTSFDILEREIPALFAGKTVGDVVRVWVAACATGEEAYSIAMLLLEHAGLMDAPPASQVFATDLDESAIGIARDGLYPDTISADVSEERLRRFCRKEHRGYQIRREVRECVLFAVHDLLKDAPFSQLNLISCRNLLIYLTREAQARLLDIFHFALQPNARLFLGSSDSVEEGTPLFKVLDKKHRLYEQAPVARAAPLPVGSTALSRARDAQERARGGPIVHGAAFRNTRFLNLPERAVPADARRVSWEELHFRLIEHFAPPSLIVTREYEVVHASENAGQFLQFPAGEPSVNLLRVVHPMLRVELRAALFRAVQTSAPAEAFRVPAEIAGKPVAVDIRVTVAKEITPDYLLVVFSVREGESGRIETAQTDSEPAIRHLEREIEQLKARLRDTVEQYETRTEELKANNEELQAMNEELRSATEELETGREELQSYA